MFIKFDRILALASSFLFLFFFSVTVLVVAAASNSRQVGRSNHTPRYAMSCSANLKTSCCTKKLVPIGFSTNVCVYAWGWSSSVYRNPKELFDYFSECFFFFYFQDKVRNETKSKKRGNREKERHEKRSTLVGMSWWQKTRARANLKTR